MAMNIYEWVMNVCMELQANSNLTKGGWHLLPPTQDAKQRRMLVGEGSGDRQ